MLTVFISKDLITALGAYYSPQSISRLIKVTKEEQRLGRGALSDYFWGDFNPPFLF
jgi:hypothetical protein